MRRLCRTLLVLLLVSAAQAEIGEVREWVSNDGRPLKGKLLEVSGDEIVVEKEGRRLTIPVRFLSRFDQEYVAALLEDQAADARRRVAEEARLLGFKEGKFAGAVKGEWVKFARDEHGLVYQLYIGRAATRKNAGPLVPLFVHLHGASGRSEDVEPGKVEIAAQELVREDQYEDTPGVVCVPLCPPEPETWGKQTAKLESIIDDLVAHLPIDRDRIYLSGYSQGARGISALITSRPDFYAGALFADGSPSGKWVDSVTTPMWFYFSGERDSSMMKDFQARMGEKGVEVKFDVLPGTGHNGIHWKLAKNPEVFQWLFQQRKQ